MDSYANMLQGTLSYSASMLAQSWREKISGIFVLCDRHPGCSHLAILALSLLHRMVLEDQFIYRDTSRQHIALALGL